MSSDWELYSLFDEAFVSPELGGWLGVKNRKCFYLHGRLSLPVYVCNSGTTSMDRPIGHRSCTLITIDCVHEYCCESRCILAWPHGLYGFTRYIILIKRRMSTLLQWFSWYDHDNDWDRGPSCGGKQEDCTGLKRQWITLVRHLPPVPPTSLSKAVPLLTTACPCVVREKRKGRYRKAWSVAPSASHSAVDRPY